MINSVAKVAHVHCILWSATPHTERSCFVTCLLRDIFICIFFQPFSHYVVIPESTATALKNTSSGTFDGHQCVYVHKIVSESKAGRNCCFGRNCCTCCLSLNASIEGWCCGITHTQCFLRTDLNLFANTRAERKLLAWFWSVVNKPEGEESLYLWVCGRISFWIISSTCQPLPPSVSFHHHLILLSFSCNQKIRIDTKCSPSKLVSSLDSIPIFLSGKLLFLLL